MLKTLTAACAGVVALLGLSGGGPAGPGAEVGLAAAGQQDGFVPITDEMLRNPDPADWLMAHRTYDFQGRRGDRHDLHQHGPGGAPTGSNVLVTFALP